MEAITDPPVGQRQVLRTYFPAKIEGERTNIRPWRLEDRAPGVFGENFF